MYTYCGLKPGFLEKKPPTALLQAPPSSARSRSASPAIEPPPPNTTPSPIMPPLAPKSGGGAAEEPGSGVVEEADAKAEDGRGAETKANKIILDLSDTLSIVSRYLTIKDYLYFNKASKELVEVCSERIPFNHNQNMMNLSESFKNANVAKSYSLATIQPYMLNGSMTLHGHTNGVKSVIQLKDGRLVSASADNTLKVWDLTNEAGQQCVGTLERQCIGTLERQYPSVNTVIQLKNENIVSGHNDGILTVWDLTNEVGQQCVAIFRGDEELVWSLIQLDDGKLVSGGDHGFIKVWDLTKEAGQQCVQTLEQQNSSVTSVIQLKNGNIVSVSDNLNVWDLTKEAGQQYVQTLEQLNSSVTSVIQLKDGRLVAGESDDSITVWDLTKEAGQQFIATLGQHEAYVSDIGYHKAVLLDIIQLKNGNIVSASYNITCQTVLKMWGPDANEIH